MRRVRYYRKGVDPGADNISDWIALWYGDPSDLNIEVLTIPCPTKAELETEKELGFYKRAFQKNQTTLHSFLKYTAWRWLDAETACRIEGKYSEPDYEVRMYFPIEELLENVTFSGSPFDPTVPQVLEKGRKDVFADFGDIICADVFGKGACVEIGNTQPYNLCMPLVMGLVICSVWIPFPKQIETRDFVPIDLAAKNVKAYKFQIRGA